MPSSPAGMWGWISNVYNMGRHTMAQVGTEHGPFIKLPDPGKSNLDVSLVWSVRGVPI